MQIHYAVKRGDLEAVKRDKSGVDPVLQMAVPVQTGYTPLMVAAFSPHAPLEMLEVLVEQGANVNAGTDYPPLMLAAKSGSPEKVQFLIKSGAEVDFTNRHGQSALSFCLHYPHPRQLEVVDTLLKMGANPNTGMAVAIALARGEFEILHRLFDFGAKPRRIGWTPLLYQVVYGDLDTLRTTLQAEAPIPEHILKEAWRLSLIVGEVERALLLSEFGASPEDDDLFTAVIRDRPAMVEWLIGYGADVNQVNSFDDTPLMEAAMNGSAGCVRVLIEHGADVWYQDTIGSMAINEAANADIVRLLVDAGADINHVAGDGYNLLKLAAERGDTEMVRALLDMGADPNVSSLGHTPLYVAVTHENYHIVKLLLEAGADPNIGTLADSWYPLQEAQSTATLELLLDAGADLYTTDAIGRFSVDHLKDPALIAVVEKHQKR